MGAAGRIAVAAALVTLLLASPARAISVNEIIELSRAGVSEDVLVALVQTGRTVFTLDAEQILALKMAGVSDRVVVAMTETGRAAGEVPAGGPAAVEQGVAAEPENPAGEQGLPAPGGVIGGAPAREEEAPSPVVVVVPAPILMPYFVSQPGLGARSGPPQPYLAGYRGFGRFINDGFIDTTAGRPAAAVPGRFINDGTRLPPAPRKRP